MISLALSMGMAKDTPAVNMARMVEMPTTSPARFTSGPPELPLLMAASVWMYPVVPAIPSSLACDANHNPSQQGYLTGGRQCLSRL